jgi:hypothetical protein
MLWLAPALMIATGMSDKIEPFQVAIFMFLCIMHSLHIGIRHGTTPDSEYANYYNQVIDQKVLTETFVLGGGMNLNPTSIDRELNKAIAHIGCQRKMLTNIELFTSQCQYFNKKMENPKFYENYEWNFRNE